MCRIYGYFGAQFGNDGLSAARDAQWPGGPDQQHYVLADDWGLGCNRLSIQDPSSGSQPFSNQPQTIFLVFNGEIYNFREIKRELSRQGVSVEGDSDGSILMPYYELYGDHFVERLDGMFAIALVDLRHEPVLKLWCDRLAIKSLYYTISDGGIAFASEVCGLSALVGRSFDVDPVAVDAYFDSQCIPNGMSLYRGVACLLPGEQVVFGRTAKSFLYAPDRHVANVQPDSGDGGTPAGLRQLLTDEVARMTLQSGPIAVQVSGGLDSSVLATLLRRRRADVTGFHVTHEGGHRHDERAFAADAAAHAGIALQMVEIRERDVPDLIHATIAALGPPNATPHAVSAFVLFREISMSGFKVCFVGDGADEQFGGYRRYSTALAARDNNWPVRYLDRLSLVPEAEYLRLYSTDYRAFMEAGERCRPRALEFFKRPASSRLEQVLSYDRLHKLPSLNLRKLDQLSMAHSVEARVPFCQPRVTLFAQSTPDSMKVEDSRRKHVLWEAGRGLIPVTVQARSKQPFTFPVEALLMPGSKLWQFTTDVLATPALCSSGFLDKARLNKVLAEHVSGVDHSRLLWGLMVLELTLPGRPAS